MAAGACGLSCTWTWALASTGVAARASGAVAGSAMRSTSPLMRSILSSSSTKSSGGYAFASIAASMRLSMMWVSSPRRIAPAMRALPFSVCRPRRSDCDTFSSAGLAFQSRRSPPIAGTSSCASSTNTGSSCSSISSCITRFSRPSALGAGAADAGAAGAGINGVDSGGGVASSRAVSAFSRPAYSAASPGPSRRAIASVILRRRVIEVCSTSASYGSFVCRANGIHCSIAAARLPSSEKPAVPELLASVCAARMKDCEVSVPGALRHAANSASSVVTCSVASLM